MGCFRPLLRRLPLLPSLVPRTKSISRLRLLSPIMPHIRRHRSSCLNNYTERPVAKLQTFLSQAACGLQGSPVSGATKPGVAFECEDIGARAWPQACCWLCDQAKCTFSAQRVLLAGALKSRRSSQKHFKFAGIGVACSLRGQCCSEADRLLDGLQQHHAEALVEVTLRFLGISSLSSLAQLSLSPDGPVGSEAKMSGGQNPHEGVLSEGSHIDPGCCKNWCTRQCASACCRHIVRDSLRCRLGKKALHEAGNVRASVKTVRESVKPALFFHISFTIARSSAKEQQELAMCWRWVHASAIVIVQRVLATAQMYVEASSSFNKHICEQ